MLEMCSQKVFTDGFMIVEIWRLLDFSVTLSAPLTFLKRHPFGVMHVEQLLFFW